MIGVRVGNWLTAEQGKRLLAGADRDSLRGKRNYAILAMLIGCGLRRGELLGLPLRLFECLGQGRVSLLFRDARDVHKSRLARL